MDTSQGKATPKVYDWKEPLPKGQEWSIVKISVPRKGKKGGKLKPLTVYVARDERAAAKYAKPKGHPTCPEGRAVFTRMEMAQILDTCEKFPRKEWRKIMLDCIKDATAFKLTFGAAKVETIMTKDERAKHKERNPAIDPKDMEPVSYKSPDTKKKKPPVRKRLGPDVQTRQMFD